VKWLVVCVLVACSGPAVVAPPAPAPVIPSAPTRTPPLAPIVDEAAATIDDTAAPPVVVIVDAEGRRFVAAAATWSDLAAGVYTIGPKPAPRDVSLHSLTNAWWHGVTSPKALVEKLETLPPPPPPGPGNDMHWGFSARKGELPPEPPDDDLRALRVAKIFGQITDKLVEQPAVVLAAPTGNAAGLVRAIAETTGMIGVAHRGAIRRLRFQFVMVPIVATQRLRDVGIELVVSKTGVQLETVKHPPVALFGAGSPKLADAIADANKRIPSTVVGLADVLVTPDADVQRLVDTLVALDLAGVRWVGLGMAPPPGSEQARLRRERIKRVGFTIMQLAGGEFDQTLIRDVVVKQRAALLACFESATVAKPDLQGELWAGFFITTSGTVAGSRASGVDPTLETCVQKVISKLEFSKPQGPYGVQVHYKLVFRQ
jgi:hypothetical protein